MNIFQFRTSIPESSISSQYMKHHHFVWLPLVGSPCYHSGSSQDMAFSAGTAEGRKFVYEKGKINMSSPLAMASSSSWDKNG